MNGYRYVNGASLPNRPIEGNFERELCADAYESLGEERCKLSLYEVTYRYSIFNFKIHPDDSIGKGGGRCPGLGGPTNMKVLKNQIFWVGHNANLSTLGGPTPAGPHASVAYVHRC